MARLIKWLFILVGVAFLGLAAYAYLGPVFGVDFAPPERAVKEDIILETN